MRPSTIPDSEVWEGAERITMGPPAGHDITGDIRAVEMLARLDDQGRPVFSARIVLEEGDLEHLAGGGVFWVSFWGQVVPFDVAIVEPT